MEARNKHQRPNHRQPVKYVPRYVTLRNVLTNEKFACMILNEEFIDGVAFYVADIDGRTLKLNKSAYNIVGQKVNF